MNIHSSQKLFRKAIKKTKEIRSVSPIIAIVLLIGLTVIAMAILAVFILGIMDQKANVTFTAGSLQYDLQETKNQGHGMGLFTISLSNSGNSEAEIVGFKIQYQQGNDYYDLNEPITVLEGVTSSDPAIIKTGERKEFHVLFPLISDNADNEVRYRITYLLKDGTQGEYHSEHSYGTIGADRPTITYQDLTSGALATTPSKFLRRTTALQPTVSDPVGGEWKEVIYTLSNGSGIIRQWTIEPSQNPNGYLTNWNTRMGTTLGIANGTYTLNVTVIDWAGLSANVTGNVKVDNDYVAPTINLPFHFYEYPNGTKKQDSVTSEYLGEVGSSMTVEVNVTDSGSFDSGVETVVLYYRVNTTGYDWQSTSMSKVGGTLSLYRGNIPSSVVNSDAMDHKIVYFIKAIDKDGNVKYSNATASALYSIKVTDTFAPDITFTPSPLSAESGTEFYITATITDKDQVNDTTVVLYWRWYEDDESSQGRTYANDTNMLNLPQDPFDSTPNDLSDWNVLTVSNQTGSQYSWLLDESIVKLYGIAYFIEARDRTGNVARDGSPSSPNTIIIVDSQSPIISIRQPSNGKVVTEGESLEVIALVFDNDPTFGINGTGFSHTGSVILEYRDLPFNTTWIQVSMTIHPTLNPSDGGNSTGFTYWNATIPSKAFNAGDGVKDFELRVKATDQSQNPTTISSTLTLTVVAQGTPVIQYVDGSAKALAPVNSTLTFTINNSAQAPATATITAMQITITNVSGKTLGTPIATQINTSTTTLWTNSTVNEGTNGSKITLTNQLTLSAGGTTVDIKIRFVSSLGNTFNLTGFEINVTIFYTFGSGGGNSGHTGFILRDLIQPSLPYLDDFNSYTPNTFPSSTWTKVDPGTATTWSILDAANSKTGSQSLEVKDVVSNVLTYSYIHVRKFTLPFEAVFQYYMDRGEGSATRVAFIFDSDVTNGKFYYAGWRGAGGSDIATIGQYTGIWNDQASGSLGFDHGKGFYDLKVSITSNGVVTIYAAKSGSGAWSTGAQLTISGLPKTLQLGIALYSMVDWNNKKIKTQLDNFGVYEINKGPTTPPLEAQEIQKTLTPAVSQNYYTNSVPTITTPITPHQNNIFETMTITSQFYAKSGMGNEDRSRARELTMRTVTRQ